MSETNVNPNGNHAAQGRSAPTLAQTVVVQRNPFTPPSTEARPDVKITVRADPTKEYVPSGQLGYYPFLRAQPPYVDDISQQFGLQVYEQMLKDPVVYASERVFTLAMLANGFEIVPSLKRDESDYDVAVKMADFVRENLEDLKTPYDVVLEQQLNAFEYGCAIAEQIYTLDGQLIRLQDIRDKPLQNTIFVVDSYNNTVGMMTQRFPGQVYPAGSWIPVDFAMLDTVRGTNGAGSGIELDKNGALDMSARIPGFLPRHLFAVLTNEMRYNDERGHSGLRAAYSAWWFKQQTLAEYLAWLSKFASPSLVGETAPNAQGQDILDENLEPVLDPSTGLPMQKTPEQVMSEALASFQNGSALAVPNGSKVMPVFAQGNGEGFARALGWADMQIAMGITFQYLATMEGQHQARASSETHQDVLSLGILRRKRWLANQQRREVFLPLLRYNFDLSGTKIARYVPRLNLGMGDGFPITPQSIAQLASAKYLDRSQYDGIDEKLGLPKRDSITVNGVPMTPSEQQAEQAKQLAMQLPQANANNNPNAMKAALQTSAALQGNAASDSASQTIPQTMPQTILVSPNITVNVPKQEPPDLSQVQFQLDAHIAAPLTLPEHLMKAAPPQITVHVPEAPAPQVHVNIEPTPVTVHNNVSPTPVEYTIEMPETPPPTVQVTLPRESEEILTVERDDDNRIKRVLKRIAFGDVSQVEKK